LTVNHRKRCPDCRGAYSVVESRDEGPYVRRRWCCDSCRQRATTYEVSRERYQELIKAAETLNLIRSALGGLLPAGPPASPPALTCQANCKHWGENGCGFDWPEAGGSFATECSTYASP
jgi:hypothetical protein